MTSIAIYVEGGGDSRDGKAALRQGFDALLDRQKNAARIRRMGWKLVLCGGRGTTFEAFQHAASDYPADIVALLVDAERPVANAMPDGRVAHLASQDRWELGGVTAERVHLMTQCMEAWIIADAEQLAAYYGKDFRVNALPRRTVLDDEPKDSLYSALRAASKDTQKGAYSKIKHASDLLNASGQTRSRPDAPRFSNSRAGWTSQSRACCLPIHEWHHVGSGVTAPSAPR